MRSQRSIKGSGGRIVQEVTRFELRGVVCPPMEPDRVDFSICKFVTRATLLGTSATLLETSALLVVTRIV